MENNGMLLTPEFHQALTLTLAERLEIRELKASSGKLTRALRADVQRHALIDAQIAVKDAIKAMARLDAPRMDAGTRSLADLIAAVR